MSRIRVHSIALAVVTMAIGLLVHFRGAVFGPIAQDMLGDALWAAMVVWMMGALAPNARLSVRSVAAYAVCVAVEVSQLCHWPTLDAIRGTRLGHLVLGSGFDPRDLVAYALGVAGAALLHAAGVACGRRTRVAR